MEKLIERVRCLSSTEGVAHLRDNWLQTAPPPLFWSEEEIPFAKLEPLSPQEEADLSGYQVIGDFVRFIASGNAWPENFDANTRVYVASSINGWGSAIGMPEWELRPQMIEKEELFVLEVPMNKLIEHGRFSFKFVTSHRQWLEVSEASPNREIIEPGRYNLRFDPHCRGNRLFRFVVPSSETLSRRNVLVWNDGEHREVCSVFHHHDLCKLGSDSAMGAIVEAGRTIFRVFAPRAARVTLEVSQTPAKRDYQEYLMQSSSDGTWTIDLSENLSDHLYHYRVEGRNEDEGTAFDLNAPILDPYAQAALSRKGPGIVISPERLSPGGSRFEPPAIQDAVLVESHLRDLLAKSALSLNPLERLGFSGLRKWALDEGNYLRSLGANVIELQPLQEFDNLNPEEYHWGYMPVNYFAPASAYSSDPISGSGIEELRAVVEAFHQSGLAVVIDVVYNHVGLPAHLALLDKAYYFDHDDSLAPRNWSGCGNDLRRDAPMARRLILDSLVHWIKVFDVDGFRFDLAELLEPPLLEEIEVALRAIKPSILLIAEPWSFRGRVDMQLRDTAFSSWNDGFRDFVRSYLQGKGDCEGIFHYLKGSPGKTFSRPSQSINYLESHDDHCFIDAITENADHDGSNPSDLDARRARLGLAITLFAQGVPMLAAGQDFLRSKSGHSNTYQRGDLNALDYEQLQRFEDLHQYCRAWISFRLSTDGEILRQKKYPEDSFWQEFRADRGFAVALLLNAEKWPEWPRLLFAINPHAKEVGLPIAPEAFGKPTLLATAGDFDATGLTDPFQRKSGRDIVLPPTELALWKIT